MIWYVKNEPVFYHYVYILHHITSYHITSHLSLYTYTAKSAIKNELSGKWPDSFYRRWFKNLWRFFSKTHCKPLRTTCRLTPYTSCVVKIYIYVSVTLKSANNVHLLFDINDRYTLILLCVLIMLILLFLNFIIRYVNIFTFVVLSCTLPHATAHA